MLDAQTQIESAAPIQLLVVTFPGSRFKGEILPELDRLKRRGVIRVLDMLLIRKDPDGRLMTATASDLDWNEATAMGSYLGSLAGFAKFGPEGIERGSIEGAAQLADGHIFDEEDIFRLTEATGDDTTAAMLLIQHTWAHPLLDAVRTAGGVELMNEWIPAEGILEVKG